MIINSECTPTLFGNKTTLAAIENTTVKPRLFFQLSSNLPRHTGSHDFGNNSRTISRETIVSPEDN
jgi:hypothetical protein